MIFNTTQVAAHVAVRPSVLDTVKQNNNNNNNKVGQSNTFIEIRRKVFL